MKDENYYTGLRNNFLPDDLRLIIIAESPPASGKYFYDINGSISEPLFRAFMHDILRITPPTKSDGLRALQNAGMFLVDAVYKPVNKGLTRARRDRLIVANYPALRDDLIQITPEKDIPVLLIKKNICVLLEPLLVNDGFRVLNNGQVVPFPSSGQQGRFREIITSIIQGFQPRADFP